MPPWAYQLTLNFGALGGSMLKVPLTLTWGTLRWGRDQEKFIADRIRDTAL